MLGWYPAFNLFGGDEQPVDFENPCPGEVADIKRVADGLKLDHNNNKRPQQVFLFFVVDDEARGWDGEYNDSLKWLRREG